ncbi:MAG: N-acetyltransferase [Desulfocapsa sp.]|jgi:phosphinothricin acetyltransferase|uniref:N-acetyltransferase n=1 Tax=Desulfotalea psychrophila TaxID=84980 RepID=A0ABS3AUG2_9BACT|nr:N-acetyltransferase [Desulfocapsa sp.]MBN4045942.1 N-acetyltransferase [bacterium AH-315-P11]MBN4068729.1 N-acetyltransferase [Desulfotalea psychrophila]
MQIRIARQNDLKQLLAIYNQAIADGNCTADITPLTMADRREWFKSHSAQKYPIFVMEEVDTKTISGWCSLSGHRKGRMALENVAEISYYVDRSYRGKGIGRKLMQHALLEAPKLGLHNLFAILLDINQVSVKLLKKNGFTQWGHLPDIAEFPDKICGQFIYGRKV